MEQSEMNTTLEGELETLRPFWMHSGILEANIKMCLKQTTYDFMDWISLTQVSISVERWTLGSTVMIVRDSENRRVASKTKFLTAS